jgi:ABC-type transport system involved in multi-copper enzyme maturation permease subunit
MLTLPVSRRAVVIAEGIAVGGVAAGVILLAVIAVATLLYVWAVG